MAMLKFAVVGLLVAFAVAACGPTIPNTPQAQACVRECMIVRNTCEFPCGTDGMCKFACSGQERRCQRTCPGVTD